MILTENSPVVTSDIQRPGKYPLSQPELAVGTHCHPQHVTKTIPVFLPADREACWFATSKFGLPTVRWQNATRKHVFLYPHGDWSGLRKLKKDKEQH